ncbi:MAG TPA: hypothetical protein VIJ70_03900 [Gaiellaceae bacterium]
MSTTAPRADAAAASVGAADLFVLRRVGEDRFVHFGGSGRGAGWAGLIEVVSDDEVTLATALRAREPVRIAHGGMELVFGPYYATAAVFVPVTNDVVVVFGGESANLEQASDESLQSAATLAAEAVESVTPAKRLADELEELEGVRAAAGVQTDDVAAAMRQIGEISAGALSCELAAVYLADGDRIVTVDAGWKFEASDREVGAALSSVLEAKRFPYCVQDAAVLPLPAPLDRESGIRSYYLLELHGVARGVLFIAHTDAAPRGFTLLCRRLGLRLGEVASAQLGVALTREWCSAEAERLQTAFAQLDA